MTTKKNKIQTQLPIILREFIQETATVKLRQTITLDARLEQDLGLGSLERAELFSRIEKSFGIHFPESLLAQIKTLNDLVEPIQRSNPPRSFRIDEFSPPVTEAGAIPIAAATLVEVLQHYAEHTPEKEHIFLQDAYGIETTITYKKLFTSAQNVASGLIDNGIKPGETVAIMLPTCESFFYTFFGILLAGAIPVPIYPPLSPDQIETYVKHEALIFRNAEIRLLVTFHKAERLGKILRDFIPSLMAVTTFEALKLDKLPAVNLAIAPDDAALIQYTSGSTGDPKGVLLTHQNLLANIRAFGRKLNIKPDDTVVSWLPLYHDMGLIGAWLGSLYYGVPLIMLSPITFLLHPERWLWAIHYHRATLSAGPNFAYELCIRRLDEKSLEGLDLSSWRLALNGAEAIYPNTLRRFTTKFAPYGFKTEAMFPVYGLAECAVALALPEIGRKFITDHIHRDKFIQEQIAVQATDSNAPTLEFVCCGTAIPEHEIRIVDATGKAVAERTVGELQFKGPSAMQGYYRNINASRAVYHDGWWSTGDYAYMVNGEIYITGRKKDLIVKGGRNFLPEGAEQATAKVNGVRQGCVAAFGVADKTSGTEKFIVVAETRERQPEAHKQIITQINKKIVQSLGIPPDQVILIPPKTIPKTSSGKLRRSTCKKAFIQGKLHKRKIPVWLQLTKLFIAGSGKKLKKWIGQSARLIFGIYVGLLLLITLPIMWLLANVLPRKPAAKITRGYARSLLLVCGCPVKMIGKQYLNHKPPVIFVANHASYLDVIVLLAVLPVDIAFIGKQELWKVPGLKTFLKKFSHIAVDRTDFTKTIDEIDRIKNTLQDGRSILIFPEGTFTYATGLRPFKLGAFKLAVDTKLPICPVAIKGTRTILRAGIFLPRPGKVQVTFLAMKQAQGRDLQAMSRLSAATRAIIARHCGESPIDLLIAGHE